MRPYLCNKRHLVSSPHFTLIAMAHSNVLCTRFNERGDIADVNEAISLHRQALTLVLYPHPDRPEALSNLAADLYSRFGQTGDIADMNEAIALNREANPLFPALHPTRPKSLTCLGNLLDTRSRLTHSVSDAEEAIILHQE